MANESPFARGNDRNQKRPTAISGGSRPSFLDEPDATRDDLSAPGRLQRTGLMWDSGAIDWDKLQTSSVERSVARFRTVLPSHVWDAAALEGNTFTLPEVQTLLEGVTVGGHRMEEANQVLALAESSEELARLVRDDVFAMDRKTINSIHRLVARFEALDAGLFRGEGSSAGGGIVSLGGQGKYQATGSQNGGSNLRREFDEAIEYLRHEPLHPAERAVAYFGIGALRQFFFDGNKRTSRLMMNGWLMSQGIDAISIPAARRLEFNQHLGTMYVSKNATPLMRFIVDCRPQP